MFHNSGTGYSLSYKWPPARFSHATGSRLDQSGDSGAVNAEALRRAATSFMCSELFGEQGVP